MRKPTTKAAAIAAARAKFRALAAMAREWIATVQREAAEVAEVLAPHVPTSGPEYDHLLFEGPRTVEADLYITAQCYTKRDDADGTLEMEPLPSVAADFEATAKATTASLRKQWQETQERRERRRGLKAPSSPLDRARAIYRRMEAACEEFAKSIADDCAEILRVLPRPLAGGPRTVEEELWTEAKWHARYVTGDGTPPGEGSPRALASLFQRMATLTPERLREELDEGGDEIPSDPVEQLRQGGDPAREATQRIADGVVTTINRATREIRDSLEQAIATLRAAGVRRDGPGAGEARPFTVAEEVLEYLSSVHGIVTSQRNDDGGPQEWAGWIASAAAKSDAELKREWQGETRGAFSVPPEPKAEGSTAVAWEDAGGLYIDRGALTRSVARVADKLETEAKASAAQPPQGPTLATAKPGEIAASWRRAIVEHAEKRGVPIEELEASLVLAALGALRAGTPEVQAHLERLATNFVGSVHAVTVRAGERKRANGGGLKARVGQVEKTKRSRRSGSATKKNTRRHA